MVDNIKNNKLLIPDFKSSNILIDDTNILRLTDIFMECEHYTPCSSCSIVRTYCVIDLSKNMYGDKKYNYSYIYTLAGFPLISILCDNSILYIFNKLSKEFNIDNNLRNMSILLQYACYEYSSNMDNEIINTYIQKKNYSFELKPFYKKFLKMLSVKNEYLPYISNSDFRKSITKLLTPELELRSFDIIKNKFKYK